MDLQANRFPSCGGALAVWHNLTALPASKINCISHILARTALRQLKLRSPGASETAIEARMTGRHREKGEINLYPREARRSGAKRGGAEWSERTVQIVFRQGFPLILCKPEKMKVFPSGAVFCRWPYYTGHL